MKKTLVVVLAAILTLSALTAIPAFAGCGNEDLGRIIGEDEFLLDTGWQVLVREYRDEYGQEWWYVKATDKNNDRVRESHLGNFLATRNKKEKGLIWTCVVVNYHEIAYYQPVVVTQGYGPIGNTMWEMRVGSGNDLDLPSSTLGEIESTSWHALGEYQRRLEAKPAESKK